MRSSTTSPASSIDTAEGDRIAEALGDNKMAILRNHGLLTVGATVDAAAWWFITAERTCQAQLLAMAAGKTDRRSTTTTPRSPMARWGPSSPEQFSFHPLYEWIVGQRAGPARLTAAGQRLASRPQLKLDPVRESPSHPAAGAEGATAPESLRHPHRSGQATLESSGSRPLTDGESTGSSGVKLSGTATEGGAHLLLVDHPEPQ